MGNINSNLINTEITNVSVRIVGDICNTGGVISLDEALALAHAEDLDLVEVGVTDDISVCKLMNYQKYIYELKKKNKSSEKKKESLKEIKLGNHISDHDLEVKANKTNLILCRGYKVKVIVVYKGREMSQIANGKKLLEKFQCFLSDEVVVSKEPRIEGNTYTMEIRQGKKK